MTKVEVYKVDADGKPEKFKEIEVDPRNLGKAKRAARDTLTAEGLYPRAINIGGDGKTIIAYVTDYRPDARERGKPVTQTGLVGRGRQLRRRSARR
jgi:hypothetical protein